MNNQPINEPNVQQGSKIIWTIVAAIVITAIIVGAGVWWWQKASFEKERQELQEQIDDLKGEISEVEEDEFKDWKTYRNEEYGFEVMYPREYSVQAGKGIEGIHLGCFVFKKETDPYYRFDYSICVSNTQSNIENQTREEILSVGNPCNIAFKSIRINKIDALRVSYSRNDCGKKDSLWTQINYSNRLYSIRWFIGYPVPSEDEMFKMDGYEKYNQILSTFKFIE